MFDFELRADEKRQIVESVSSKYERVAISPEGWFKYPTGREGLQILGYDSSLIEQLPDTIAAFYCGVGNPFSLGSLESGQTVLDVGCGAGVDTILAGIMVGPNGRAVGVDLVPEMLERACRNLAQTNCENVGFQEASAEALPFPDQSFDVTISNGAFNLVPDKPKALAEVMRVLKPGGQLLLADQILTGPQPENARECINRWAR
ncbi:MAG: methyltransferase domain-containing protein [Desulfobacteraceae bacterium]|nr:methyltransferase domain-containing protein [Desulfobacteraceae bacterium]